MARTPYVTLTLRNPSRDARTGYVVRQWQPVAEALGGNPRAALVERLDEPANEKSGAVPLVAQVDRLDPDDPSHDQLVFKLDATIPGGDEHYRAACGTVRIHPAKGNEPPRGARVKSEITGVKFNNENLEVWLNTSANKFRKDDLFYGGAVTSVILEKESSPYTRRLESLDALQSHVGDPPHPEARAMQIDRIHLVRPPWDERGSVDFLPFREPWRTVSESQGPVRAVATIMSAPFEFHFKDADGRERVFQCNVYRALSLYDDADWIGDEFWVNARDEATGRVQRLWFTARFFMLVQFTDHFELFRYPDHPGWFCLTPTQEQWANPFLGYAFATDAMAGAIWTPPLDYHDHGTKKRAFSWELGTTRTAHCVHKFRCRTSRLEMGHEAGSLWYDLAFKQIRATLAGEQ